MDGQQFRTLVERAGFRFRADLHRLTGISRPMLDRYASPDERPDRRTCPPELAVFLSAWAELTPEQREKIAATPVGVPGSRTLWLILAAWAELSPESREAAIKAANGENAHSERFSV